MVIFPIAEEERLPSEPISAWIAVEERQRQSATAYWLVTQPSHAALAGDLAASLRDDLFGPIDNTVARCIALHDAGWSMDDAEQIQRLRAKRSNQKPSGFLDASVDQFLHAWTASIETAGKFAPIGGYLVSRHFERISNLASGRDQRKVEAFRKREKDRQQKVRKNINLEQPALEKLVDALQFCDVLSLYLCCGSPRAVTIDNPKIKITRRGDEYQLEPSPFRDHRQFSFAALRHPVLCGKKGQSGATFYINL
jgi:hypothetical protein